MGSMITDMYRVTKRSELRQEEKLMAKIGFIGTGNMGAALITAACRGLDPAEVVIADCFHEKAKELAGKLGCKAALSNEEVAKEAEYIVLAVKPNIIRDAVKGIAPTLKACVEAGQKKVLVTIAAGVKVSTVKECLDVDLPVIRIMPNTPVMIGQGMILLSGDGDYPDRVPEKIFEEFQVLLKEAGDFERIKEQAIDYTTGVSSCAPAYTYMFIEALADGAVQVGVPREQALKLAAKTVQGAAAMVLETGEHPGILKDNVCSPGGSTIVGVNTLEEHGFRSAVSQAIIKATEKNLTLGK